MARAPFNVLVYPYHKSREGELLYALLKRSDEGWWQTIAGGGEGDETPEQAARREASEEGGISEEFALLELSTVIPVPVTAFEESQLWGDDVYVIPKYCFGVRLRDTTLAISSEHSEYRWLRYDEAQRLIRYDGERTALWELHSRLCGDGPRGLGRRGL
jgi:dATP pyrophosphohydrolase